MGNVGFLGYRVVWSLFDLVLKVLGLGGGGRRQRQTSPPPLPVSGYFDESSTVGCSHTCAASPESDICPVMSRNKSQGIPPRGGAGGGGHRTPRMQGLSVGDLICRKSKVTLTLVKRNLDVDPGKAVVFVASDKSVRPTGDRLRGVI